MSRRSNERPKRGAHPLHPSANGHVPADAEAHADARTHADARAYYPADARAHTREDGGKLPFDDGGLGGGRLERWLVELDAR